MYRRSRPYFVYEKWNKKAIEQLEKLNNNCSRTAGLEAKLLLAVGARVMLRRNIDTKTGLVNGALGTVLAVTIHKCQSLSLDSAIVELSDKVFSAGMAYVALSRVRSLAGLHLSAFDPKSIIVSTSCSRRLIG